MRFLLLDPSQLHRDNFWEVVRARQAREAGEGKGPAKSEGLVANRNKITPELRDRAVAIQQDKET